ncbi:hypothetical protein HME9304_00543 [Flagellimonas maritima]|uniref:Uncharacterized protein n=1 Tax=Flagellimonas maritima TaxID=1383885 RepID=A0A2Z4LPQ5_9FLAO|nr:hypothetical protein HME9304_00543 [Allomuricauda aurantiaca]
MTQEFIQFCKDHFYIPLYLITWAVAVYRYRRYFDTVLKYLPILIIYTFFTELLGYFIKNHDDFQFFSDDRYDWHNVIIYNIYQIVFFLFFYWVYWKTITNKSSKKIIKYGAFVCLLSYIVSAFFQNPLHEQLNYAHAVGSLILIFALILYFNEKRAEKNPFSQKHNLLFWVGLGLFIFYVVFPFILLSDYLNLNISLQFQLRTILLVAIVLMYSLFMIGLVLGKRKAFR